LGKGLENPGEFWENSKKTRENPGKTGMVGNYGVGFTGFSNKIWWS